MVRSPARRDGAVDADARHALQKGYAPALGVFPRTVGVHHGGLSPAGSMAWLTAQRVWLRASLDRGVECVKD